MSPLEELYLVLAAIYLADCLHWVRAGASVFTLRWKRVARASGGALFGNERAGFNLAWPLPLGCVYVCDPLPLALAPEGVLALELAAHNPGGRAPQSLVCLEWKDAAGVKADGRKLRVASHVLVQASSVRTAERWAAELRALAALEPSKREKALERIAREPFDTRAIRARLAELDAGRARLQPLALALFVYCFAVIPLLVELLGLSASLFGVLAGLLVLQVACVWSFARAHARLWPAERGERRGAVASIALAPPGAMRAADLLSRDLFADRHPLAVASVLCERGEFEAYAAAVLRDARHPQPAQAELTLLGARIAASSGARELAALERFLVGEGLAPAELDRPPERLGADSLAYCPRCQNQYMIAAGNCERCSELALVPFARGA